MHSLTRGEGEGAQGVARGASLAHIPAADVARQVLAVVVGGEPQRLQVEGLAPAPNVPGLPHVLLVVRQALLLYQDYRVLCMAPALQCLVVLDALLLV